MKLHRLITLAIAIIMAAALLVSCSSVEKTPESTATAAPQSTAGKPDAATAEPTVEPTEAPAYPICEPGAETLTFWLPRMYEELMVLEDFSENPTVQRAYEVTGVNVEFELVLQDECAEKYALMLASNDITDIVGHHTPYTITFGMGKGPDSVIEDGYFIRLNELIDDYAPNYRAWLYDGGLSRYGKEITTDAGNICGFYTIFADGALPGSGLGYRKDVMDKFNLEVPTTFSGWETVFDLLKSNGAYDYPFCLSENGYFVNNDNLASAFDVSFGFYQVGGTVKYGPVEDGYRDYLRMMRKWYEKGYFAPDDVTENNGFVALTQDRSMCFDAGSAAFGTMFADIGLVDIEGFYLAGAPAVKLNDDQTLHLGPAIDDIGTPCAISYSCENPEIACRWLDFWYSEEGEMLVSYGIEGDTYEMVDGRPQFNKFATSNPDGLTLDQVVQTYCFGTICGIEHTIERYVSNPEALTSSNIWLNSTDRAYTMPARLTLTPDEGTTLSTIKADLETYVKECTAKFIMGTMSIENDWENYLAKFDGQRLSDAIRVEQAALDRYNAR